MSLGSKIKVAIVRLKSANYSPSTPTASPTTADRITSTARPSLQIRVQQDLATMAATANAFFLAASPRLPASGAGVRSRASPAMAAVGCALGRGGFPRSSVQPLLCRSSSAAAGAGGSGRMEDYNTAMKRMMRNPYEYHHDLGTNIC